MAGNIGNDGDNDVDYDFFDTPRTECKNVNVNSTRNENTSAMSPVSTSETNPIGTASVHVAPNNKGHLSKHQRADSFSESDEEIKQSSRRLSASKTSKQVAKYEKGALDNNLTFTKSDKSHETDTNDSEPEDECYRISQTADDNAVKHKKSKCRRLSTDSSASELGDGEHHKKAWIEQTESNTRHKRKSCDGQREKTVHSDSEHSSSSFTDDSYTSSDSEDSDVTDVSPLMSPRDPTVGLTGKPPKSPSSAKSNTAQKSNLLNPARDTVDLELLMQAVLELEHDRSSRSQINKRNKSSTVLFAPHPNAARKNFSFSDDKVRSIDRENQRLMKQILQANGKRRETSQQIRKKAVRAAQARASQPRLTASAVNRMREQQRVEAENQNLLRRLQSARPTRDLRRDTLLADYSRQTIGGVSMATVHPLATTTTRRPYRTSRSCFDDGSSVSSQRTVSSRRRPQSAKVTAASQSRTSASRPHSATIRTERKLVASRPEWQAGW